MGVLRNRRERLILQSNRNHPLNRASAQQLTKWEDSPPSELHAIALIQTGLDRQAAAQLRLPQDVIQEKLEKLSEENPKRAMRYLTHYKEDREPTQAAEQVREYVKLRFSCESHLFKMVVESKNLVNSSLFHDDFGDTISERPSFINVESFKHGPRLLLNGFRGVNHCQYL